MQLLNCVLICLGLLASCSSAWRTDTDTDTDTDTEIRAETSCGTVKLQRCWCAVKDPCGPTRKKESNKNWITSRIVSEAYPIDNKLDLSGQGFEGIEKGAFEVVEHITELDLSMNKLSNLGASSFSELPNLERLNLAANGITNTTSVFAGLDKLKNLDLSHNPLTPVLGTRFFEGLSPGCEIRVENVKGLEAITATAFGIEEPEPSSKDTTSPMPEDAKPAAAARRKRDEMFGYGARNSIKVAICIKDGIVQSVVASKDDKEGCSSLEIRSRTLFIRDMEITGVASGWFQISAENKPATLSALDFSGNKIEELTTELTHVFPKYITWIDFANNKIKRLDTGIFNHTAIFSVELHGNQISEIADNAFDMPALYQLFLGDNDIKDTKFAATLPSNLVSLHLENNEISEISPGSFTNAKSLRYLSLGGNKLTKLSTGCLRGMLGGQLILSRNQIDTVEPGAFEGTQVWQIGLEYNNISHVDNETFGGLTTIGHIDLGKNKLTELKSGMFELPTLKRLDLSGNKIKDIEVGSTKSLKNLEELIISKNPIEKLKNGCFFGLSKSINAKVEIENMPLKVIQAGIFEEV